MSALSSVLVWEREWIRRVIRDPLGPMPIFFPDYLNQITLPWDWDPKRHLEGVGEWANRLGFWCEERWGPYERLPIAPRMPR